MVDRKNNVFGKTISNEMETVFHIPGYNAEILDEPSSSGSEDPDETASMEAAMNILARALPDSTAKQESAMDSSTQLLQAGAQSPSYHHPMNEKQMHVAHGKGISDDKEKIFHIPGYNTEILDEPSSSGSEDPDETAAMEVAINILARALPESTVKQDSEHSTRILQGSAHCPSHLHPEIANQKHMVFGKAISDEIEKKFQRDKSSSSGSKDGGKPQSVLTASDILRESENRTDEQKALLKQGTDTMIVDSVKAKDLFPSPAPVTPMRRFENNDLDPAKAVKMAAASKTILPIGIDLGTTNSCVAVYINGRAKIIPDEDGHRIIPSCVAFTDKGGLFGHNAKTRLTVNPSNTVYDAKRLIGRTFDDPNVQNDMKFWSFRVVDSDGKPMIQVRNEKRDDLFAAENISGIVLSNLKDMAKRFLNQDVKQAVITVPAHFNDSQRRATRDAAQYAGLEVLRIINEPTAAAMAYGFDKFKDEERTIMVYDLGGGTFDVSILTIKGGTFVVKATGGDTHLGGADFDNRLATSLLNWYNEKFTPGEELSSNRMTIKFQRLVRDCELVKCQLSEKEYANMFIDDFHGGNEFHKELHRDEFDKCNIDLFNKTLQIVQMVLDDAGMTVEDINDIVLIGGSTRIPKIQEMLSEFFRGKALVNSINPDEAVACGAAIQAAALMETPPDEFDDLLLMDVTSLTLGIEIKGDIFLPIIDRNSLIPARSTKTVTTIKDDQTMVDLGIYQGERALAKENHFLGDFYLDGIPPAAQGVPQIDVTFELDVNGILDVTAKDKDTGKQRNIQIDYNKAKMSEEQIELMLETAERFKHEDREEKERIQARRALQSISDWIIHLMQNYVEKLQIPPAMQEHMLAKAEKEKQWLSRNFSNPKAEYLWKYDLLLAECQSVPEQHLVPGNLPGHPSKRGERNWAVASCDITGINQSVQNGNGNNNESEIGDID